jgi:hypothetical protein
LFYSIHFIIIITHSSSNKIYEYHQKIREVNDLIHTN